MSTWAELMDQVMLGTHNAPPPEGEWAGHRAEQALLKQFALAGIARQAGFVAETVRTLPIIDPAPLETLAPCSAAAIDRLRKLERTSYARELIRDWALEIRKRGKRVPHTALPAVLNLALSREELPPYLLPLVGERGRWMIDRVDTYAALRQPEFWSEETAAGLKPAEIAAENKMLIELRNQMIEGLSHE